MINNNGRIKNHTKYLENLINGVDSGDKNFNEVIILIINKSIIGKVFHSC